MLRQSVDDDGARAEYAAHVYTPTDKFEYRAVLGMDGEAALAALRTAAPAEDEKRLLNLARSTARAAKRKHDDGLSPWPPRITRWRKVD